MVSKYRAVKRVVFSTILVAVFVTPASALNINLDYSYDTGSHDFFGTNAVAKAAVEQAAADVSALLTSELAPVTEVYSGTSGFTTATINWEYLFKSPIDDTTISIESPSLAANTVNIYVGVKALADNTLASGGPSGGSFSLGYNTSYLLQEALDAMAIESNNGIGRGTGPVINNFSGPVATATYNVNMGVGVGSLWFDVDTDNKKGIDTAAELNDYWHFDHTTSVAAGKYDLYTVALHEILHALGMGRSDTWDDGIINNTDWTGSDVISLYGTGSGLINSSSGHIATGIMSPRLSDGQMQEVAMSFSTMAGSRKSLTELDVAFLRDLGYTTVPEPSSFALLGSAFLLFIIRRRA